MILAWVSLATGTTNNNHLLSYVSSLYIQVYIQVFILPSQSHNSIHISVYIQGFPGVIHLLRSSSDYLCLVYITKSDPINLNVTKPN